MDYLFDDYDRVLGEKSNLCSFGERSGIGFSKKTKNM